MTNKDFELLVGPVNMLIGYCQSAEDLTREGSDLESWKTRLMELGTKLDEAWRKTALTLPGAE